MVELFGGELFVVEELDEPEEIAEETSDSLPSAERTGDCLVRIMFV